MSGKAIAAQNARTHGLSARATGIGRETRAALLTEIDSEPLSGESRLLAQLVADAQAAVTAVGRVVAQHIHGLDTGAEGDDLRVLERLLRYERRAQGRLRSAVRLFDRSREQIGVVSDSREEDEQDE